MLPGGTRAAPDDQTPCVRCRKEAPLCVCDAIAPVTTALEVLILQHPQEPDKELGSAWIAHLCLPRSTLKVGLSWPNLKAALGREVDPKRWAVLYLGSGVVRAPGDKGPGPGRLELLDRKGRPLPDQALPLDGIVVLDGTWSQAKTLWWRNAWLLKLRRAVLEPAQPSLYRELRKEPRRECLSTIESIADALAARGEPKASVEQLRGVFQTLLDRRRGRWVRGAGAASASSDRR